MAEDGVKYPCDQENILISIPGMYQEYLIKKDILLRDLCQLSVQHWCQIKTIISGVTHHYREVEGQESSLYT